MLLPAAPATAQEGVQVAIVVGFENRYVEGRWLPVSVTVESPQAISGDLEVSYENPDQSLSLHTMPIEVPGGGRKQFDLVMPAPAAPQQIAARIVSEDDVLGVDAEAPLRVANADLVGVLGTAVPPAMEGIVAEPALVDMIPTTLVPEQLSLGASALGPLSYVAADDDAIDALAPDQLDALWGWVATGGRLLVGSEGFDPQGGTLRVGGRAVEPQRLLADGRLGIDESGLGETILAAGDLPNLPRRVFEAALRAAPLRGSNGADEFFNDFGPSPEGELIRATRGDDFQLGWFVGFLVIYLVIVGPLNYLVLKRRGRKELLWVTIPFFALAFSGVAYGLARGSRGGLVAKTAGIVFASEDGGHGHSVATVSSGTGGTRTFTFPTKAAVAPPFLSSFGSNQTGSTRITSRGAEVAIETAPFSAHAARGTIEDFDGFVEATIRPAPGGAAYEVTNRTPYELRQVTILNSGVPTFTDDLSPGETARGLLDVEPPRRRVMFRGGVIPGGVRRALTAELRELLGPSFFSRPVVIADVQKYQLGIELEGTDQGVAGRMMVASPVSYDDPGGELRGVGAGSTSIVATDGEMPPYNVNALALEGFQEAVFSYQPPAALDLDAITGGRVSFVTSGPRHVLETYNWRTERWVEIQAPRMPGSGGPRGGDFAGVTALDASSFSESGEAYFRLRPNRHPFTEIYRFEVEPVTR
ncbi:MAG: hypothetical protein M3N53_13440 [Actinomycetota bacterium]|nr:hypothetical protein [Actinomycetota bacterium]